MIFAGIAFGLCTHLMWHSFDIHENMHYIVWQIRFPRYIASLCTGAIMGICGCLMQNITHNPLADANILGIPSCSNVGSILALLCGIPVFFGGIFGAVLGLILLQIFSKASQKHITYIILQGVMINSLCGAAIMLILQLAPIENIPSIVFWLMGDLTYIEWKHIIALSIGLCLLLITCAYFKSKLNYLWLDEDKAFTLGINLNYLKRILLILVAVVTGLMTSQVGSIGFIGLVAPYIANFIHHKYMLNTIKSNQVREFNETSIFQQLIYSGIIGALLLSIADGIAKNIIYPSSLSVGIITAFCGVPIFWKILHAMYYKS
jgi:iron complex transport system permease protein